MTWSCVTMLGAPSKRSGGGERPHRPVSAVNRAQALDAAAGIIATKVPDLLGLIRLLDGAGQARLAEAIRKRLDSRPVEIGGAPKPDPELWAAQAARVMAGGR